MRNTRALSPIFELSAPGRRGATLPASDVPYAALDDILPAEARAHAAPLAARYVVTYVLQVLGLFGEILGTILI